MSCSSLLFLLSLTILSSATPLVSLSARSALTPRTNVPHTASLQLNVLYEMPKGVWLENLAIRQSDSNALVTVLSSPDVWLFSTNDEFEPIHVASFEGYLGCLGVIELAHNIFYVACGNWTASTGSTTPGTYGIWEIDMRNSGIVDAPTRKVADLPDSGFLNGMAVLSPSTILVAESLYSAVWSINAWTGEVAVTINDTSMAAVDKADGGLTLGINSILVRDGYLYYDNIDRATFNRIPIDLLSGTATGPAETLVQSNNNVFFPDDFTIDYAGNGFMATAPGEVHLLKNVIGGRSSIEEISGSKTNSSITCLKAAKFGTRKEDLERGSLYVTDSGGPNNYRFSNWTSGGQFLRIDTLSLGLY